MALDQAYNVAGDLWIGPDSAKSEVSANSGRVYIASDTSVDYYGDGDGWTKRSVGSEAEPVPSMESESISTDEVSLNDEQQGVSYRIDVSDGKATVTQE